MAARWQLTKQDPYCSLGKPNDFYLTASIQAFAIINIMNQAKFFTLDFLNLIQDMLEVCADTMHYNSFYLQLLDYSNFALLWLDY